jgi:hypothetical protein
VREEQIRIERRQVAHSGSKNIPETGPRAVVTKLRRLHHDAWMMPGDSRVPPESASVTAEAASHAGMATATASAALC